MHGKKNTHFYHFKIITEYFLIARRFHGRRDDNVVPAPHGRLDGDVINKIILLIKKNLQKKIYKFFYTFLHTYILAGNWLRLQISHGQRHQEGSTCLLILEL